MFVPMWILWAVGVVVAVPVLFRAWEWLVVFSFKRELDATERRRLVDLSMDHARWPPGDPRGQSDAAKALLLAGRE